MSAPAKKSSTEAKQKDLMLDKDMEKDTWNFKSMTDDDPMDFNFELPANKKKNAFKLDMGFDLDGDFGNLSSFKMDMPDFDFSSPVKKTTKTKESPGDKSSGDLKQKKSPFTFSYDFDALDDFDLDSSPPKKGSKTTTKAVDSKAMDCEEISARSKIDKSDSLDFGPDLPITRQAGYMTNTDVKAKASAEKENLISKTTDTMVVDSSAHSKQATEESMENSEAVESPQGIRIKASPTHTMCLQPQSVNTSPPKTSCAMVEDIDDPCLSNETAAPSPLHASETAHTAANKETSPNIHEICRSSTKEDRPRDSEQNANNEMISTMDSRYEKTEQTKPNISSRLRLDKIDPQQEEMGRGTQAEMQDHTRTTASDPDAERSITLSGKISPGPRLRQTDRVQNSSAKLPLDPSHRLENPKLQTDQVEDSSGKLPLDPSHRLENPKLQTDQVQDSSGKLPLDPSHRLENPKLQTAQVQDSSGKLPLDPSHSVPGINDLKTMQNKDSGLIRSKFFKKVEKPQSDVLESSLIQTESRPVTRERIALNMNLTNDRRHDIKDALPGSKTRPCPTELVKTDSETENVNTVSSHEKIIHKDQSNANTAENVAVQLDHLKLQAKNTTREKSILQINISSKLDASSLTQKLSKNLSSGAESLQKSKLVSLERPKLGNMVSDLRSAKTQRTIGVDKDQPSSAVQPEVSSSISIERKIEAPVKIGSETHRLAPRDKTQLLHCPSSLKRKALDEDADRSLKPQLKRFLMSPRENRKAEELTHRVAQGKFSSQESGIDNNTTKELVKESSQTTSHHQIINMANLEIPITENADNIEKAEAYTKELESICNILKKKHEEAKELLVRAVVNNNKLLMLSHPLHEDKIRMIQKFAAKLTLRDTQTTVA